MILVLLGIALLILGSGIFVYCMYGGDLYRDDKEWIYYTLNGIGAVLTSIVLIAALVLGINLSNRMVIDDKIALYRNENIAIEQQISDVVAEYMDYEKETFANVKNESSITLVSLFPELKSDTLVSKQIELYTSNNQKIKELEEEKLSYRPLAWWLYFGN